MQPNNFKTFGVRRKGKLLKVVHTVFTVVLFGSALPPLPPSAKFCIGMGYTEKSRAGIFKQYMGAGNRVGIGLSYRPARPHRLAEFIPWNRFLGCRNF